MRSLHFLRGACVATLLAGFFSGCQTGPIKIGGGKSTSVHEPGSEAWWAEKAALPVGARQVSKKGKLWPPRPRPTGERQQWSHMYHASHYWPYPYVCQDRQYVKDVFALQSANGWADETTLYAYHFEPETNQLSEPGRRHLSWILTETPPQYRTVYLQRTAAEGANQSRMTSVQDALGQMVVDGSTPDVQWRIGLPLSTRTERVERIQAMDFQSIPAPTVGGGGGGGAAAGGGGGAAAGGGGGGAPAGGGSQ